jgi:hypothetical protein
VCFAKNCGTAHQGAIVKVKRGELLVSKNPMTVFGEPRIDASFLSDELMEEWMTKRHTLEDWESMVQSAVAAGEEQAEVTAAGMEAQQNFAAKANAYRTPKTKRKRKSLEVPAAIGITPCKRMWLALAEPRDSVMKMFKAGKLQQIGSSIFWANLHSLD